MDNSDKNKQAEFMKLLGPEKDRLEKYCLSMTGNREEAKDLVSETVLQVYLKLDRIKDKKKFPHYLLRVAKRLHYKRVRVLHRFFRLEKEAFFIKDNHPDASHELDVNIMYEALSRVPEKLKQAVILHEISGFPLKEVAAIEGCSLSAAKARVMRGRKKLTQLLEDTNANREETSGNRLYDSSKLNKSLS